MFEIKIVPVIVQIIFRQHHITIGEDVFLPGLTRLLTSSFNAGSLIWIELIFRYSSSLNHRIKHTRTHTRARTHTHDHIYIYIYIYIICFIQLALIRTDFLVPHQATYCLRILLRSINHQIFTMWTKMV